MNCRKFNNPIGVNPYDNLNLLQVRLIAVCQLQLLRAYPIA